MREILFVGNNDKNRKRYEDMLTGKYEIIKSKGYNDSVKSMYKEYKSLSAVVILSDSTFSAEIFRTLEQYNSNPVLALIPIIVVSELNDECTKEHFLSFGVKAFLVKPDGDTLYECIKEKINLFDSRTPASLLKYDSLTKIFKREAFFEKANEYLLQNGSDDFVMSCINVDNFKVINDRYGNDVGDKVLQHIALSLSEWTNKIGGVCGRITADDFALIYPISSADSFIIKELHKTISTPKCIERSITLRTGRYIIKDLTLSVNAMYDRAKIAADSIRGNYEKTIELYNDYMRENLVRQQQIVSEMAGALKLGQFEPFFQPQYNHATGAMVGAEVLVRWKRNGEYIPPSEFIPLFEQSGFIYEMDKYIWEKSCKLLRQWIDNGVNPLPISVNISRKDIFHEDFILSIMGIVKKYEIPYDLIRFEVTESAFSESTNMIVEKINELINLGFTIEIDDFGSGYSSLNTLKDVYASILKIDMKFFEKAEDSKRSGNIIESVVRMAKWLGMSVIAEGVEDKYQADFLRSIGCYYIQGYFYEKPMSEKRYTLLLKNSHKEQKLSKMKTIETLNNSDFWNPRSMETLIFNSYVGGACIFEYLDGKTELLRINEQYIRELGNLIPEGANLTQSSIAPFLSDKEKALLNETVYKAINTNREASCEVKLKNEDCFEYIRITLRLIASAGKRNLFYCVILNMTAQREAERKEIESAQKLQIVMDNVNGGVSAIYINDDGTSEFVFNNERYFELYGYTRKQAEEEKLDVMSLILPEDFSMVMEKVKQLKADKKPVIIDYRVKKRDGEIAYIRTNASLMNLPGKDDVITSSLTDVTEQYLSQQKERNVTMQLTAILANMRGGVSASLLKDGKVNVIFANKRYYEMYGYTKEEYDAEVNYVLDVVYPDDRDGAMENVEKVMRERGIASYEMRCIKRDGSIMWQQISNSVIMLEGIEEPILVAVADDITELHEKQNKITQTSDILKSILLNAGNGITAVTLDKNERRFVIANDKYFEIIGYTREEYVKKNKDNPYAIVHPEDKERVSKTISEINSIGESGEVEYRVIRSDGQIAWVNNSITISDISGIDKPVQVCVVKDITAEKAYASQLQFLNDTAHSILSQSDIEKSINDTLERILDYFQGDRCYVLETNLENKTTSNTYEVCASGVESKKNERQRIPMGISGIDAGRLLKIENTNELGAEHETAKRLMIEAGINSAFIVSLNHLNRIEGYVEVENPKKSLDELDSMQALGDYISILISRRNMLRRIKSERDMANRLMNDTPGGFLRVRIQSDKKLSIVTFNEGFCRLMKMTHDEVASADSDDLFKYLEPEDKENTNREISEAFTSEGQYNCKYSLRQKDGNLIWVMVYGRFINEHGEIYLNAFFTDISEKQEEEERQKALLDNLMLGAALYEFDGKNLNVIHINRQYWKLVEREEVINKDFAVLDAVYEDDRQIIQKEIVSAIIEGRSASVDIRIICGKSEYKPFHISANIIKQPDGKYMICATYEPIEQKVMSFQEMLPKALQTMMSTSKDLSYIKDRNLRYICCSRSIADLAGYKTPEEIVDKTASDIFESSVAEKFDADDRAIIESRKPVINAIENLKNVNGEKLVLRTSKYPILDMSGNVIGIYCISNDITSQEQMENQLKFFTNYIPGGYAIYIYDKKSVHIQYCNDSFCNLFGIDLKELSKKIKKSPLHYVFPDDCKTIISQFQKMIEEGTPINCIHRIICSDGTIRWIHHRAAVSKNYDGSYTVYTAFFDVTDSQKEKELLRLQAEEYKVATEHSNCTICRYDIENMTLLITTEASKRLELPEIIEGVPYDRIKLGLIAESTSEVYREFYENIVKGEKKCTAVFKKYLKDQWRWVKASATTIFDSENKPVSAIITYTDVTDEQEKEVIFSKYKQSLNQRKSESYTLFCSNLVRNSFLESSYGTLLDFLPEIDRNKSFNEVSTIFAEDCICFSAEKEKYLKLMNFEHLMSSYFNNKRSLSIEFRMKMRNDEIKWIHLNVELVEQPNSSDIFAYIMFEDIDEMKQEEIRTKKMAETDFMTGLMNREVFVERFNSVIENNNHSKSALMLMDIDGFKQINDSFGHMSGDRVLVNIGDKFKKYIGENDFVCRFGGDEFMVCLSDVNDRDEIMMTAKKLSILCNNTFDDKNNISFSVGISIYPDDGKTFDVLYEKSDRALYYVKRHGKNKCEFFTEK